MTKDDVEEGPRHTSRATMKEGLGGKNCFSNDGVNRCLLVLITPRVKEDYGALEVSKFQMIYKMTK